MFYHTIFNVKVEELTEEMVVEPMDPKIMMESENMSK